MYRSGGQARRDASSQHDVELTNVNLARAYSSAAGYKIHVAQSGSPATGVATQENARRFSLRAIRSCRSSLLQLQPGWAIAPGWHGHTVRCVRCVLQLGSNHTDCKPSAPDTSELTTKRGFNAWNEADAVLRRRCTVATALERGCKSVRVNLTAGASSIHDSMESCHHADVASSAMMRACTPIPHRFGCVVTRVCQAWPKEADLAVQGRILGLYITRFTT